MSICNQGKLKCQIRSFFLSDGVASRSALISPLLTDIFKQCSDSSCLLLLHGMWSRSVCSTSTYSKIAWPCMYIEYSDKTKLLVFGLQVINRDSSPLNTLLKKLAFQQIFQQMLTLNYDRRQFTSLWQPWFFTLHGTSVVDNGNRLCKDTTWLGCIGIPVIFGLPFHGITTPNRPTGSYNSQSMVGISS